MPELLKLQTIDNAGWLHPPEATVAACVGVSSANDDASSEDIFTSGLTHWPTDVRIRLRLADPVRQEANRRRLLDALAKPGPLWDPANLSDSEVGVNSADSVTRGRLKIHVSEAEATRDFGGVLTRVRNGMTVIIQHEDRPIAVVQPTEPLRRTISECIALAKAHEEETGKAPTLDADFASDVEEVLRDREIWKPPEWE